MVLINNFQEKRYLFRFQNVSPIGSHENLNSPQSPESHRSERSRKDSDSRRISVQEDQEQKQSTSEMFKDLLSQKRNMILSKLSSFDSEGNVSVHHSPFSLVIVFFFEFIKLRSIRNSGDSSKL